MHSPMHRVLPHTHQQVGQQDGHDNEEDDPKDIGYFWEGGQQVFAFIVVPKISVILKFPNGHHHGLDEGETGMPKRRYIDSKGNVNQLQWRER